MAIPHLSVMLEEVMRYLEPKSGGIYIDGTLGAAGHTLELLKRSAPDGRVIGIDRDVDALDIARERLRGFEERVSLRQGNFSDMERIAEELGVNKVDGILLDVGVSSMQLDRGERGFSFMKDAPLDMRMDRSAGLTAAEIVNEWPLEEIERVIREYGEERHSRRIASQILRRRESSRIETTLDLARVMESAIPPRDRHGDINPATRTFQGLRIAVNDELRALEEGLEQGIHLLKKGGRFCVISFHSLEDRIVKNRFRYWEKACVCPKEFPVCRCGKEVIARQVTKGHLSATEREIADNPRSRSARLRVAERL